MKYTMAFDEWKTQAKKQFPEFTDEIGGYGTPYLLWAKLRDAFFSAYEHRDESLIKRIYEYSDWCISQPQGLTAADDLATCVSVCFYEDIPTNRLAREDMPRWFTASDFFAMQKTFEANLSAAEFEDLKQRFQRAAKA